MTGSIPSTNSANEMHAHVEDPLSLKQHEVMALMDGENAEALQYEVSGRFLHHYNNSVLEMAEARRAEQLFRILTEEAELSVRKLLADKLKLNQSLPHDIAVTLARDVEEVALPMVQYSEVLRDNDILGIIAEDGAGAKSLAVAKRAEVPAHITDALIALHHEAIDTTLADNAGAHISEAGYTRFLSRYTRNETLLKQLSERPDVPHTIAERIVHTIAEQLKEVVVEKHAGYAEVVAEETKAVQAGAIDMVIAKATDPIAIKHLVAQLIAQKRLTSAVIIQALAYGNTTFVSYAFASLARIPHENAVRLLKDRGSLGFQAIYTKIGMPQELFAAVKLLFAEVIALQAAGQLPGTGFYNNTKERLRALQLSQPIPHLPQLRALLT